MCNDYFIVCLPFTHFSDESKGGVNQSAFLTVVRSRGLYNTVSVRWVLLDGDTNEDVGPATGLLTFLPGQSEAIFRIQSTADEVHW